MTRCKVLLALLALLPLAAPCAADAPAGATTAVPAGATRAVAPAAAKELTEARLPRARTLAELPRSTELVELPRNTEPSAPAPAEPNRLELSYRRLLGGESAAPAGFFLGLDLAPRDPRQAGYQVFEQGPDAVAAGLTRDFDPGYRINPGDTFRVTVWGGVDEDLQAEVDDRCQVFFPKVGVVALAGADYRQAEERITAAIGNYYKGAKVYVLLTGRSQRSVYVIGHVRRPGVRLVPPQTSLVEALIMSGGITRGGSLRAVQVRKGDKVASVDLYGLLLTGAWEPSVLTGGELVYVPAVGPSAAVLGEVLSPGIYELLPGDTLASVLAFAGGPAPSGHRGATNVYRPVPGSSEVEARTVEGRDAGSFGLRDGDVVQVPLRASFGGRVFSVSGAVMRPGTYELREGLTLAGAIALAGGLQPRNGGRLVLHRQLQAARAVDFPGHPEGLVRESIQDYPLDPASLAARLEAGDRLEVPAFDARRVRPELRVLGEVVRPGTYEYKAGLNAGQLIGLAGGLTPRADLAQFTVARQSTTPGGGVEMMEVGRLYALKGEAVLAALELQPGDLLSVPTLASDTLLASVEGEFARPGAYLLPRGSRISDLVAMAGGYRPGAFLKGSVFCRASVARRYEAQMRDLAERLERGLVSGVKESEAGAPTGTAAPDGALLALQLRFIDRIRSSTSPGRVAIELQADLDRFRAGPDDLALEEGDSLSLPTLPGVVSVLGQVNNPNTVTFNPSWGPRDYLDSAGGFTRQADRDSVFVIRAGGRVVPVRNLTTRGWITGHGAGAVAMEPGDTVLVPEDFRIQHSRLQVAKDVTQIMFQVITSVGIAVAAF